MYVVTQNSVNGETSFEALLSHVISELSKDKSVYKVNAEETPMVSRCLFLLSNKAPSTETRRSHICLHGRGEVETQGGIISPIDRVLCCCSQLMSSVWSPQSIEFSLQQFCLPFLRLSCLLQHHLYGDALTGCPVRPSFPL